MVFVGSRHVESEPVESQFRERAGYQLPELCSSYVEFVGVLLSRYELDTTCQFLCLSVR